MRHTATLLVTAGLLLGLSGLAGESEAADHGLVRLEVRIWQGMEDGQEIHVGARQTGGSWRAVGMVPLSLVGGNERFRWGDIKLEVPLANWAAPARVEVRVWQSRADGLDLWVSARQAGGSWRALGTNPLLLDDGLDASGRLRYGDIAIDIKLTGGVTTLASGLGSRGGIPVSALWERLGLATDQDGDMIVADRWNHVILRIESDGSMKTVAGGWGNTGLVDGPAETARFNSPEGVAVSSDGSIYVADTGNHRIRKVAPDGMVTTVAGSDRAGADIFEIRDGPAEQALLREPRALAFDSFSDLYIVERFSLRRLSPSGWVSTITGHRGTGWPDTGWRDGPVATAQFQGLNDIAIDDADNIYVIDDTRGGISPGGQVVGIRRIDTNGIVTTLYRDEAPSLGGTLAYPSGIAVTTGGTVYLANTGRDQLVKLTPEGKLVAIAGTGQDGHVDGPLGVSRFRAPGRMALAPDGSLLLVDQLGSVIRRIVLDEEFSGSESILLADFEPLPRVSASISILAGSGSQGFVDGTGVSAQFFFPKGMALDLSGNLIVADSRNYAIRAIAPDGKVTTIAGGNGKGSRDGPCREAQFSGPSDVAVAASGSIYVADPEGGLIRRIDPEPCWVVTVAGKGPVSLSEEGWGGFRDGPVADAELGTPTGIAFDRDGNLFITDTRNNLVRRLSPDGHVDTVVGIKSSAYVPGPRDGPGLEVSVSLPGGIAIDYQGNVYFTESTDAIRELDRSGYVSTVYRAAGYERGGAFSGFLRELAFGLEGEIYVADLGYERVFRLTPDGILSIVVDENSDLPGGHQHLNLTGLAVGSDGTLFVSASQAGVIFEVTFE